MRTKILILISAVTLILVSCLSERVEPVLAENIHGEWTVIDAYRNNKKTILINRAFINITDSTFSTDIPTIQSPAMYSYQKNDIILKDNNSSILSVIKLMNDTLTLETELQKLDFKIILERQKENK